MPSSAHILSSLTFRPVLLDRQLAGQDLFMETRLLPTQYPSPHKLSGTQRLQLAVLEQALRDLQATANADQDTGKKTANRMLRQHTRAWFMSPSEHGPFCFVTICLVFGWNPEAIRARLLTKDATIRMRRSMCSTALGKPPGVR